MHLCKQNIRYSVTELHEGSQLLYILIDFSSFSFNFVIKETWKDKSNNIKQRKTEKNENRQKQTRGNETRWKQSVCYVFFTVSYSCSKSSFVFSRLVNVSWWDFITRILEKKKFLKFCGKAVFIKIVHKTTGTILTMYVLFMTWRNIME